MEWRAVPLARAAHLAVLAVVTLAACTTDFDLEARRHRDAGPDALDVAPGDAALDGVPAVDACATCAPPRVCCAGACVDPNTSPMHCGGCAHPCPNTACLGGSCTDVCLIGFADCDNNRVTNGCEVDLATSAANCGACGTACPPGAHAVPRCTMGVCGLACEPGWADCDGDAANGCEANVARDPTRCGACNHACRTNEACTAGACACAPGFADCDGDAANGCETDTRTSAAHCGACGRACGANATCAASACACDPGFQRCPADNPAGCTVQLTDARNCGACGVVCADPTPACTATGCARACAAGQSRCGDSCVDMTSDVNHCGACGVACPVRPNATARCVGSVCGFACQTGFADCNGVAADGCEVDITTNIAHCGACGATCAAGFRCVSGRCVCPTGLRDCGGRCAACCQAADCNDGNPCTTDSCGAGGTCANAGCAAGLRCCTAGCAGCCGNADCTLNRACSAGGTCAGCVAGYGDCDGDTSNGCETDTSSSITHCGRCGNACSFPNAAATCVGGACRLGACNAGFADCDGNAANGCETNLGTSLGNCGACGSACSIPGAVAVCNAGRCERATCATGLGDCDGNAANGCETDLTTSVANCGGCGTACAFANAAASCAASTCVLGACAAGYGDCDGVAGNGCETDVGTSVTHCGACGATCAPPHAVPACTAGACGIATCEPGFADCDGAAGNGCETDIRSDVNHCGACSTVCARPPNTASATCAAGRCGFTCAAGFADCNGVAADGCEVDTRSSVANCGGCGTACTYPNGTGVCASSSCVLLSCNAGFANCNVDPSDGCEVNTTTSVANCGACGTACALPNASASCSAGACAVQTCRTGYNDCDGTVANGCETSCGADRTCGAGGACAAGWVAMRAAPLAARQYAFYAVALERHELLVWGGTDGAGTYFADGARYSWDTDTWVAMAAPGSTLGARAYGAAAWTGSALFVWGGRDAAGVRGDGATYDPATNVWTALPSSGAPVARAGHYAYFDGATVVVYGGTDASDAPLGDGARFDLGARNWSALAPSTPPGARAAAAWTGSSLLVFGGDTVGDCSGAGTDALRLLSGGGVWSASGALSSRPAARWFGATVGGCARASWPAPFTGVELFVWGGVASGSYLANGALYNPATDAWRPLVPPPAALATGGLLPVVVWTGQRVLGWSLATSPSAVNVTFSYDPAGAGAWSTYATAPLTPVYDGAAFGWTGTELIVWGGRTGATTSSGAGARFAPGP